ncbi:DegV family protein [Mycoplasmatota bacterium WC30]
MEKIGLLIDSTTLTRDDLKKYDFIKIAQLKIQVDGITYSENEISRGQMEINIVEGKKLLTSQPSPAEFLALYEEYYKEGYTHVITICLSNKLSGTYQSAMLAKTMIEFDLEVEVHSPNSAAFGVALGSKIIADLIREGKSFEDIVKKYHILYKEPAVAFTLGDLNNLLRGGRLNRVQAFVGKILKIKPIIEMIDGKLELVGKERSLNACIAHYMNKIDYYAEKYNKVYLDIITLNMADWAIKLLEIVKEKYDFIDIHITDYLSPVFYSHLGNKGFGIAIVAE